METEKELKRRTTVEAEKELKRRTTVEAEKELKLLIDLPSYEKFTKNSLQKTIQTNHYFFMQDMPTIMIRIRQKGDDYELTLKVPLTEITNDIFTNKEYNMIITQLQAEDYIKNGINTATINERFKVDLGSCIATYVGNLVTCRNKIIYDGLAIEVDENKYLGFTDYELECECDDENKLNKLKQQLSTKFYIKKSAPKFIRFIDMFLAKNDTEKKERI